MKIVLGVLDQAYTNAAAFEQYHQAMRRALGEGYGSHMTTGDVAEILEARYSVMGRFVEAHLPDIAGDLENGLAGALESALMGAPATLAPFAGATEKIDERFRDFLSSGEIETMGVDGVPTEAAKRRRSLRFKKKVGPNKRPSFVDTGLYQTSFRSEVKE